MNALPSSQDDDSSSQTDCRPSYYRRKQSVSGHPAGSLLRLALVTSLVTAALFLSFLGTGSHAQAAAATKTSQTQHTTPATTKVASSTLTGGQKFNQLLLQLAATYTSAPQTQAHTVTPKTVTPKTTPYSYNGLGDLPFYSYVDKKNLTDQVAMKVNVANGNVVLNTSELKVSGTGLNLSVGSAYNSEEDPTALLDDGNLWYFSTGRGVTLDLSNIASGITLHGPSGYSTFFAADSTKSNGFDDAPGLHASIAATGSGTYTITFQHGGEQWGFNRYGSFLLDGDKNGNSIQYNYNPNGDLTDLTDTQGRTVTFQQGTDANNNLHQVTSYTISTSDGTSKTISHTYTAFALSSVTNADLKTTQFQYDSVGRITTITDPLGKSTSFAYTGDGKIATITDAKSGTTQFAYHPSSDSACSGIVSGTALPCTVVTDQNGHSTTYAYTHTLQVTGVKDALGRLSSQAFDSSGYNVANTTDALTNVSTFGYDSNNNQTSSKDATGATSSATYTPINNAYYPQSQTDAQGNVSTSSYDGSGNVTSQKNTKSGSTLTYTYNSNGTIATQYDADSNAARSNGHQIAYSYDATGNLTTVTPTAPLGATTLSYDQLSRLTSETDGNGHTTSFSYDHEDRITHIAYSGPTPSVSYTYDSNGNVISEIDGTGTTSFSYDALNRELSKTLPSATVISNGYDGVGNLTSLNDGTGTTTYTYNAANLMDTLTAPGGGVSHYGYDKTNHRTCLLYPNGTGMILTYDAAGRELSNTGGTITATTCSSSTSVSGTPMTGYSYNYGSAMASKDVLQTATIHVAGNYGVSGTNTYSYDTQNRLIKVVNPGQTWTVGYDANGNMTSKTYAGASTFNASYTYNNSNELTSASATGSNAGSATYHYDGNGNETSVTNGASGPGPLSLAQTHSYNTSNQDSSGSGTASGSSSSYSFGYSGTDQNERVNNNSNASVYTGLGLSAEKTSATTSNEYVRCSCGMLNSERTSAGQVYYYLFDGLDSIVGMTDSSGALVASYDYDPFGNLGGSTVQSGLINPWGYAGGYTDTTTGLIKFGIRYYDAHIGRWTQATPIGGSLQEAIKANPYAYADENPISEIDPNGKSGIKSDQMWDCIFSVAAAAGVVFAADLGIDAIAGALDLFSGGFLEMALVGHPISPAF